MKSLIVSAVFAIALVPLCGTGCDEKASNKESTADKPVDRSDEKRSSTVKLDRTFKVPVAEGKKDRYGLTRELVLSGQGITYNVEKVPGWLVGHWDCKDKISQFEIIGPDDAQLVTKSDAQDGNFSLRCTKPGSYVIKFWNGDTAHERSVELTGSYKPD